MKSIFFSLFTTVLFINPAAYADEDELCSREDIESVCISVSSSKTAMDCYKQAKGKYAGIHCESECKEKIIYCIENEKISLKKIFDE